MIPPAFFRLGKTGGRIQTALFVPPSAARRTATAVGCGSARPIVGWVGHAIARLHPRLAPAAEARSAGRGRRFRCGSRAECRSHARSSEPRLPDVSDRVARCRHAVRHARAGYYYCILYRPDCRRSGTRSADRRHHWLSLRIADGFTHRGQAIASRANHVFHISGQALAVPMKSVQEVP